jgi:pimeloyl-ACP methyl ester carboxylesterase
MGGHAGSDLFRRLFPFRWVPNAGRWRRQPIEHTDDYCLAVVEFDDQGWFQDFHQRDLLQRFLNEKANRNEDLLIVVFIHGWQHNAEPDDTSLQMFRSLLSDVCLSERHRHNRPVLGVYLSWRGLSLSGAWMLASFWTRKKAATRVALGCVREILARLRAYVEGPDVGTRLIVAGHSFGGLILFTAVSEYLIESVILCQCNSEKHIVRPFGDLIILINPAFEAARYLPLYSVVLQTDYPKNQRPCFLTVTSTNDDATGNWFPIGRWFDTRLESVRRNALPWGPPNAQGEAILNTMGHLQWLITHKLSCPKTQESAHQPYKGEGRVRLNWDEEEKDFNKFNQRFRADGHLQENWKRTYSSGAVLEHVCGDPDNPFWTIEATPEVVDGHSDIYRPVFLDFLRQVCDDRLRPIAC